MIEPNYDDQDPCIGPRWTPGSLAEEVGFSSCRDPGDADKGGRCICDTCTMADAVERLTRAAREIEEFVAFWFNDESLSPDALKAVIELRAAVEAAENWGKR